VPREKLATIGWTFLSTLLLRLNTGYGRSRYAGKFLKPFLAEDVGNKAHCLFKIELLPSDEQMPAPSCPLCCSA